MSLRNLKFTVNGIVHSLVWPLNDVQSFNIIMKDWIDHAPVILSKLQNKRTVIQAGGHCGLYAKLYANLFDKVFTFEPDVTNFRCLVQNCLDSRVVKINCAVSEKSEFVSMGVMSQINSGMNKVLPEGLSDIVAYSIPIDSMNIQNVDLIHLDVEGFEYEALKGATNTIKKYHPLIVLELSENQEKIYNMLKRLKYVETEKYNGKSINSIFEYKG